MTFRPLLLFLVAALSACASHPAIIAAEAGRMPDPRGYWLVAAQPERSRVEAALAAKLETSGFSADEKASLIVQVSLSEPPAKTGLALDQSVELQWLLPPTRSKSKRTRRLVVTMTDSATGKEIYRAYGSEVFREKKSDDGEALQTSVFALIP
ncbi:hypothetical protein SKP52_00375 [Sphingopyxis fribergensis]|uniref:DUF4136 domain-containing protein n=1 Tax=Sphingopyxis fribergensis TaxID=1515612 RepID=A0A0A7PAL4_9SPHN|nr:DUF4136 domain-containing protein [Sphingopyxis fribergensis]AJA07025.1 hypothetical protein SKP52_00375 [Sphingopyxis fribergensis]